MHHIKRLVLSLQPVGFVTFNTRAGAEAAKQDLQVGFILFFDTTIVLLNYLTFLLNTKKSYNTSDQL